MMPDISSHPMSSPLPIPVLLLKTKSQPDDGYEAYFSRPQPCSHSHPQPQLHLNSTPTSSETGPAFKPTFIPVLEHTPNVQNLGKLEKLLRSGRLREEYGGMIFTSQRAVEGWRGVVERVESQSESDQIESSKLSRSDARLRGILSNPTTSTTALEHTDPALPLQEEDIPFPLYVVGPATHQSLASLIDASRRKSKIKSSTGPMSNATKIENERSNLSQPNASETPPNTATSSSPSYISAQTSKLFQSPFLSLSPTLYGSHTGSGAALAPFILTHYNALHTHRIFTFWEAPRLPFIPLVGPGPSPSKTASGTVRKGGMIRLEKADKRLDKKKLLFLVGEQRRDVIPRTLGDEKLGSEGIGVDELEVYGTVERSGFAENFTQVLEALHGEHEDEKKGKNDEVKERVVVVVVFSPQGCESMLRAIGYIDATGKITGKATRRWNDSGDGDGADGDGDGGAFPGSTNPNISPRFVIATIGPTTRDHLRDKFGYEPDVVAQKPSPEGVGEGVRTFLRGNGVVMI